MRALPLVLLVLAFGAPANTQTQPIDRHALRVEVLALLSPKEVVVTSLAPAGATLDVAGLGNTLIVRAEAGQLAISTPRGRERLQDVLEIDAHGGAVKLDVKGRDRRQRTFHGPVTFSTDGDVIRIVAKVDIEDLVASAVAAELDHFDDPAALEAAAIALRSFYLAGPRHSVEGFDFCDSTHCAHSQGDVDVANAHDRAAMSAAEATHGQVLTVEGTVLAGYFTACCGGRTATPDKVWGSAPIRGYTSVRCEWCSRSEFYRWRRTLTDAQLRSVASSLSPRKARVVDVRVARASEGIVGAIALRAEGFEETITGDAFRMAVGRTIGWDALPSPRFKLDRNRGRYVASGSGFGHCIGLCLEGAVTLARRGATSGEILRRYYPEARIDRLPEVR